MAVKTVKATINGTSYTLTKNSSSGLYEATVTAPGKSSFNQSGGFYDVSITAYDEAGNVKTVNSADSTLGSKLKLYVKEKVAPTITVSSPTSGAVLTNNKPTISWKCADADSGVNKNTIKLYIDGSEASGTINATLSGSTYSCSYVPSTALSDGSHTLKFACSDNDGNAKETTATIKIDTVPPVLNVSSPADTLKTNQSTVTVSGNTNDATSSPVKLTINGNNVTVNSDGSFSTAIALTEGTNTLTIKSTDSAGKSTTVTRTVYYDSKAPTISNISIVPNPVDAGKTFVISATVTD